MFAWSDRHHGEPLAEAFHTPGREIQRQLATKEPTPEQLEVGLAAMAEILRVEHDGGDDCRPHRLAAVFGRIDHIGVAVEDIDAALALYESSFEMALAHRETVESQGVEAVLLDVGDGHVELLAPLGPDTPVGKFLAKNGRRPAPRRLRGRRHRRHPGAARRRRHRADRLRSRGSASATAASPSFTPAPPAGY